MARWLRRLFVVLLLSAVGAFVFRSLRHSRAGAAAPTEPPSWPPFDPPLEAPVKATPDWVAPVDGTCPEGFPIKGNANSHIYHVPGGRFYERTVPERCYATESAAERDGYRRAKA